MKIEHFAYQVDDPAIMADWYCQHLGFTVKRAADSPNPVRFLADASDQVMIEIYNNSKVETPDYASMDPLLVHLAFSCDDISAATHRLVSAGARLLSDDETASGDRLAMLRDPWDFAIQLCQRKEPMLSPKQCPEKQI
ncbi:VOC family protein [Coraliomargarita akajimensis]|uniref:Glyoxalase/bleomycin resistance protein/dioxygenase n=1 Tax=Coraliomargarita akajimensis (strain DSM 45221 / IAM 15411 / JCM 23193 / KCTC 12865 / 04OKA010-24) TaxID=583355 RepID=D5EN38_CORAD|nr:VOC family protein [Coraliomargarita akajimensis]ADE53473.1 Glyoxalase/bleomycin resistance protein/dioxygenase [Coraliomargarita akajimensis DSM 45221]